MVNLRQPRAREVVRAAEELGVLAHAMSASQLRLVTHLDFAPESADKAAELLLAAIDRASGSSPG
jgi:hypothetical protein